MKRSECKLIERDRDHYFEVYEAPSGEWYLEALVGGPGTYSVTMRMTAEEIAAYQDDPLRRA